MNSTLGRDNKFFATSQCGLPEQFFANAIGTVAKRSIEEIDPTLKCGFECFLTFFFDDINTGHPSNRPAPHRNRGDLDISFAKFSFHG